MSSRVNIAALADPPLNTTADKVINLFATSAVTQGVITIICLIGTFILLLQGHEVPTMIYGLDGIIIGFFFGGKLGVVQGVAQVSARIRANAE